VPGSTRVSALSELQALPRLLAGATTATAVEAVALGASFVWLLVHRLTGHRAHDSFDFWFLEGLVVFAALALGWTARGLLRRRRWSRSPSVITQLLGLPIGIDAISTGVAWVGIPLLACSIVGLVGLFAPSTTEVLAGDQG
jgi:hypothetical protein